MTQYTHAIPIEFDFEPGPLWPFKHNEGEIEFLKTDPYVFSAQYMQEPAPKGGGIVKSSWWREYDVLPYLYTKIITADTAQKTKEYNDFSVFQCWGLGDLGIYLIDQIRGKWEAPELLRQAKNFFNKHNIKGQPVSGFYVEDKSSGTGLIQTLRNESTIPIIEVPRHKDKVTRMHGVVRYIASGRVFLPVGVDWLSDYILEFSKFTALLNHKHDDQIDPTMDAIEILLIDGVTSSEDFASIYTTPSTTYEGDF